MQNILITLCARGGSKGIPRKNIKLIDNTPLIAFSIKHAKNFKNWLEKTQNATVVIELSTDDKEIKDVVKNYELSNGYWRPDILANDTAGKQDVIKDILLYSENEKKIKYDLIVDLDVSSPMRTNNDLIEAFESFKKQPQVDNLFSVSNAKKNPYFNMVEKNSNNTYSISKKPKTPILSRQKAPKVYEMNASFYFYKRCFFDTDIMYLFKNATIFEIKHDCFDLDHEIDFDFFDYLVVNNKLSFKII